MGFHSDSEPGVQGAIASVSLGRFHLSAGRLRRQGNEAFVLQPELHHV